MKPLFSLGDCVATPGALDLLERNGKQPGDLLIRHTTGDWGELCDEDWKSNEHALHYGERILSAYVLGGEKVWVITEWDRSVTTILLPDEY